MRGTWNRVMDLGEDAAGRVRDAVDGMRDAIGGLASSGEAEEPAFSGLQWMTAGLFIAAGAEAALRARGNGLVGTALRWAPLVAAPLAGAAHAARAVRPGRRTRMAACVVDGMAAGVAAVGVGLAAVESVRSARGGPPIPGAVRRRVARQLGAGVAPLTFGATAALGFILDREEEEDRSEHRRLARRGRIVERLVPRRRPKLDHIVLHV